MFVLHLSLSLTGGVAWPSSWTNLGLGSKTLRNIGLNKLIYLADSNENEIFLTNMIADSPSEPV